MDDLEKRELHLNTLFFFLRVVLGSCGRLNFAPSLHNSYAEAHCFFRDMAYIEVTEVK